MSYVSKIGSAPPKNQLMLVSHNAANTSKKIKKQIAAGRRPGSLRCLETGITTMVAKKRYHIPDQVSGPARIQAEKKHVLASSHESSPWTLMTSELPVSQSIIWMVKTLESIGPSGSICSFHLLFAMLREIPCQIVAFDLHLFFNSWGTGMKRTNL